MSWPPASAIELCKTGVGLAADGGYDCVGADAGLVGRPAGGDAADEDVAAHLLRVEAEPGARRLRGAALAQQIGHDRLQRRDRHEHVARRLLARRRSVGDDAIGRAWWRERGCQYG